MSKKAKPEKKAALFYKDQRSEAERILDAMQFWRDEQELQEMNGRRCGNKQARWLRQYGWRQRVVKG